MLKTKEKTLCNRDDSLIRPLEDFKNLKLKFLKIKSQILYSIVYHIIRADTLFIWEF